MPQFYDTPRSERLCLALWLLWKPLGFGQKKIQSKLIITNVLQNGYVSAYLEITVAKLIF